MNYPILSKLYYKDKKHYISEAENRKNSISSKILSFSINNNPAFYINCQEMTCLLIEVYQKLVKLKKLISDVPGVALESYASSCLIDEILLTNDIEGVYSTKKEISDILKNSKPKSQDSKKRLVGLVRKYSLLASDKNYTIDLANSENLRSLYDEIVASEIDENDLPDGRLFRKESVSIVSVTDREKHKGISPPEEKIIEAVEQAFHILYDDSIPKIIRIALFHYFIGYIHPFYDGNGRLSRFISSYYIKEELDLLIALRLSHSIKNNKKAYYSAFDYVNDPKNLGDTTPFILMFLEMLIESENSLLDKLEHGTDQLNYYGNILVKIGEEMPEKHKNIFFILIQSKLFGDEDFDITSLSEALDISVPALRNQINEIHETEYKDVLVKKRKGHKYTYSIDLDKIESYLHIIEQDEKA